VLGLSAPAVACTIDSMGSSRIWWCVMLAACGPTEVDAPISDYPGESFDNPYEVQRVRLQQTDDTEIAPSLSLACSDAAGTKENSWYRIFKLADFDIDSAFTVHRVNFGVQTAIGDQRVKVAIGTYAGNAGAVELDTSKIDLLGLTTVQMPEGKAFMAQANFPAIEIPADSNLVVEIRTEGRAEGSYFYLGATDSQEMIPGYLRAPTCNTPNPLMTSALGYVQTHLVIAVSGTHL
jgi:hypothetical protein